MKSAAGSPEISPVKLKTPRGLFAAARPMVEFAEFDAGHQVVLSVGETDLVVGVPCRIVLKPVCSRVSDAVVIAMLMSGCLDCRKSSPVKPGMLRSVPAVVRPLT